MEGEAVLKVSRLKKSFGGVLAVYDVSFELKRGEFLGIIGPNGSGKTTLVNLMTGFVKPDSGQVFFRGKDITRKMPYTIAGLGISRVLARVMINRGGMRMSPFYLPMMLPNMGTANVGRLFGFTGYNNTCITACAAGTHAIGEAAHVIRRGDADVMITGGTEAGICELGLGAFCTIHALTTRNDEPEKASRPFDADRDGFAPAEGAGILFA